MRPDKMIPAKTFSELFDIILTGNKDDSRKAAREVRKLLYNSHDGGKYNDINKIIENAPNEYHQIKDDWREENFVVAVSVLYFLHNRESQPDFLFPWLLYLLQNKNGNIRQSAVRMIGNELGPLTVHIRCPEYKQSKSKSDQSDFILLNLFIALNILLSSLGKPEYKKYKYIDSLPTCPYKSIQMILSRMEDDCGEVYIKRLSVYYFQHMNTSTTHCPICQHDIVFNERYPLAICKECVMKATDETGRPLKFYNQDMSGGLVGEYRDTGEPYTSNQCVIDGIPCHVQEAHMGGIVIQIKTIW